MILDFILAALPWVAIGLITAVVLAKLSKAHNIDQSEIEKINKIKTDAFLIASGIAYFTAIILFAWNCTIEGCCATFASIGSMFIVLASTMSVKSRKTNR